MSEINQVLSEFFTYSHQYGIKFFVFGLNVINRDVDYDNHKMYIVFVFKRLFTNISMRDEANFKSKMDLEYYNKLVVRKCTKTVLC